MGRFGLSLLASGAIVAGLQTSIDNEASTRASADSALDAAKVNTADIDPIITGVVHGPGLAMSFGPTTEVLGTGSEHDSGAITTPDGLDIADNHKYRINGQCRIVGGATDPANAGKHLATVNYRDVTLKRVAGAWVLDATGDTSVSAGETITGTLADYFVTNATDLPAFGDGTSHSLRMFYTHAVATYVILEGDFSVADIGT